MTREKCAWADEDKSTAFLRSREQLRCAMIDYEKTYNESEGGFDLHTNYG